MRRAALAYLLGASIAGVIFVFAFTLAQAVPPRWALVLVLAPLVTALLAVVYLNRTEPDGPTNETDPGSADSQPRLFSESDSS
jgi:hypothetical protein